MKSLGEQLAERVKPSKGKKSKEKDYDPFDELATALGVSDDKKETFRGALKECVHASKDD